MKEKSNIKQFNDFYSEVSKEWHLVGKSKNPKVDLDVEMLLYKKMIELLEVGASYFFVFVPPLNKVERVSPSIKEVLGWESNEFSTDFFVKQIHPDDLPTFVDFEKKVVEFKMGLDPEKILKYKSRYNYRIRKSDGSYIPILQQSITIQSDETGAVIRNFIVHTDISEYKTDHSMKLSFIGLENEPSFLEVSRSPFKIGGVQTMLTEREAEVVELLAKDYSSAQIAEILFVSVETVRTHRKNILKKTGTNSTLQLVLLAKDKGWI